MTAVELEVATDDVSSTMPVSGLMNGAIVVDGSDGDVAVGCRGDNVVTN